MKTIKQSILLIILSLLLSGCFGSMLPDPVIIEKPITIEKTVFPALPSVPYPSNIVLVPFNWDYPRTEELDIINSKKCLIVKDENKNTKFWKDCGINKVDLNSNIYIGLDETNYRTFIQNWDRIIGREKQWRSIVDEVNRQREEFKKKNSNK
jgi:hypothetical protein